MLDTPVVVLVVSAIVLELTGFVGIVTGGLTLWAATALWLVAIGLLVVARLFERVVGLGSLTEKVGRGT